MLYQFSLPLHTLSSIKRTCPGCCSLSLFPINLHLHLLAYAVHYTFDLSSSSWNYYYDKMTSSASSSTPSFTESSCGFLDVMIDLYNAGDSSAFQRTFKSELFNSKNSRELPIKLSSAPLLCSIIIMLANRNVGPVVGSVCQCGGTFIDQDEASSGIRFSVFSWKP